MKDERQEIENAFFVYGYRHFDPQLGRWISRDPIGKKGGVHLHGLVGNNGVRSGRPVDVSSGPERRIDPA